MTRNTDAPAADARHRCTICNSTGFDDRQCLGCGTLVADIPEQIESRWDYPPAEEWSPLKVRGGEW